MNSTREQTRIFARVMGVLSCLFVAMSMLEYGFFFESQNLFPEGWHRIWLLMAPINILGAIAIHRALDPDTYNEKR